MNYKKLSDDNKLGLLQLLYHDLKAKEATGRCTARDIEQKALLIEETQRVYGRLKQRKLS